MKTTRMAWAWYEIPHPALLLAIPYSELPRAILLFGSDINRSFVANKNSTLVGLTRLDLSFSDQNEAILVNRHEPDFRIEITLNEQGQKRFLVILKSLLQNGTTAFIDLDEDGLSELWLDFSVETSEAVYDSIVSCSRQKT